MGKDIKSKLRIVLGENFFSLSELGNMAKGDVLIFSQNAGEPVEVFWNNQIVAEGAIVVMDEHMGIRITGFLTNKMQSEFPGVKEKLIDTLRGELVMAELAVTPEELYSITENSIINIGKPIQAPMRLNISGNEIARGHVTVVGEKFGLEIDEVSIPEQMQVERYPYKSTGNILKADRKGKKVKLYNFKTPDVFTLKQIVNLNRIHERFIDNFLFNAKAKDISLRVTNVDQLAFHELFEHMKDNKINVLNFGSGNKEPKKMDLVELESTPKKLSDDTVNWIKDNIIEKVGTIFQKALLLYTDESSVVKKDIFEISLKKAWEYIGHVEPEVAVQNASFTEATSIIPKYDMITIACLEVVEKGTKSTVTLVYPYTTIEDLLPKLQEVVI